MDACRYFEKVLLLISTARMGEADFWWSSYLKDLIDNSKLDLYVFFGQQGHLSLKDFCSFQVLSNYCDSDFCLTCNP